MPTALITGANRGLGLEFTRQYAQAGWKVIAVCRTAEAKDELDSLAEEHTVEIEVTDVADFDAVDALAARRKGEPIDLLINNAGVFGPKGQAENDPRQSFDFMDYAIWADMLRVNTMAPFKLVESFLDNLKIGEQKKVVTISSTMGSIGDASSGVYAYRSTKCAVNMTMVALSNELAADGVVFTLLCPGWVSTRMGGAEAPVTASVSVTGMRTLIDEMSPQNSGQFRRFNGETVPW